MEVGPTGQPVFLPNRSKRWAVGYADGKQTCQAIRDHLETVSTADPMETFSLSHVKWLFWAGFFQRQYLGVTINYCNSCCQHRQEAPADHCKCVGFHETDTGLRYSRLPTGPRTYRLDVNGNPPEKIYETRKERRERLQRELDKAYVPMGIEK